MSASGTSGGSGREDFSLRERLRARAAARSIPLKVQLELTKRCNLRCYHCYLGEAGGELSTARVLSLLDEIAELGCMGVILTGGEVALRDDFFEIARGVKQRRMTVSILTNGTLLGPSEWDAIAALRPSAVASSVYSADPSAHDAVTGVAGSFEAAVATVRGLTERGVRCKISSPLMRETFADYSGIIELAEGLGCRYAFDPTIVPTEDGDADVTQHGVGADELRRFFLDERLTQRTREGRIVVSDREPEWREERRRLGPCAAGITSAFVGADGVVLPCMGFRPGFGSIAERSFAEVWHGPAAVEHRRLMAEPAAACEACELLTSCTVRCPRLAVEEGRPMRGPNSRACELAAIVREMRDAYATRT